MNRSEHMQWSKDRANSLIEAGEVSEAFSSMVSDLGKHEETENHPANELGLMLMMSGNLSTASQMRDFIEGYN